jgi:hypothetical protein
VLRLSGNGLTGALVGDRLIATLDELSELHLANNGILSLPYNLGGRYGQLGK